MKQNKFINNLRLFYPGTVAAVPGYTFFTTYPPPIFPGISILTTALAAAVIYITWTYNPRTASGARRFQKLIRLAILWLVIAFICLFLYVVLLRYCTVLEPQTYKQRFQVGFWKLESSLTQVGLNLKREIPAAPLEDWMLRESAFRPGGPEIIWTEWSITIAGFLLVFTYMAGFVIWTAAFSLLAKHKTNAEEVSMCARPYPQ